MVSTRFLPQILLIGAALCGIAACTDPARQCDTPNAFRSAGISFGVPPLVAQSWPSSGYDQPSSERPVRIRAKSVIRLGLLIAAIIGGLISYFVRLASRGNDTQPENPSPEVGDPQVSTIGTVPPPPMPVGPFVSSGVPPVANGHIPPVRSGAIPPKPLVTPPAKPKSSLGWALGIGMVAGLVGLIGWTVVLFVVLRPAVTTTVENQFASGPAPGDLAFDDFQRRWQAQAQQFDLDSRFDDLQSPAANPVTSEPPVERFPELGAPEISIPPIEWTEAGAVASGVAITRRGMSVDDTAPPGGLLVGFRVTQSRHRLESIQPIYQRADEYVLGDVQGSAASYRVAQLLAKPGDAVASLRLDLGGRIEGLRVEFGKVVDGRVDSAERYSSPFFGREVVQNAVVIEGEGDVFFGVSGTVRDGLDAMYLKRNMELATSEFDAPVFTAATRHRLPRAGGNAGNEFDDAAPAGGLLVGMRFFIGRSWGGAIQAVRPIYQVGTRYELGGRHGPDGGLAHQVIARPGYAIGEMDARAGLALNSVQIRFMRITNDGLDSTDAYDARRFGSPGGSHYRLDSSGHFIVGLGGSYLDDMISLHATVAE